MELKECIYSRRSVRKYKPDPISHEVLEELIQSACMAPSGVNLQPWFFVVLESRDAVEKYRELMHSTAGNFRAALEARFPKHPQVVEDTLDYMATMGGAPVIVLAFLNKPAYNDGGKSSPYVQSVAAAIENMLLLAWDKGIASCWMTAPFEMGVDGVLEQEYAPEHGDMVAAVALGYPNQEPPAPRRKTDRVTFL